MLRTLMKCYNNFNNIIKFLFIRMKEKKLLNFPEGFLWGTGTAAHQIEGGNINDWSEWEKKNAARLAKEAGNYWQNWQKEKFPEMFDPENYISGRACDSYNRYEEDFDLALKMNNNSVRFGIEWSRIEPEEGKWNMAEIEHYKKVLLAAKKRNLKTMVTLWHWTNPLWLYQSGGWSNKKAVDYFSRYTALVVKELGQYVDYWITLNEPMMHIAHGYITAKFPPNKIFNPVLILKVFHNLTKAHRESYKIIHAAFPAARVSIAMTSGFIEPVNKYNPLELLIARAGDYFRNHWYLQKIAGHYDYIGVNYYHHDRIVWYPPFKKNLNEKINDRGWEIYPQGLYHVLMNYKKYNKPIIITENGTADRDDVHRAEFIKEHLFYIHKAIEEGADVRGYFHWSLLDNFEWAEGFWNKFGLVAVDRKTFERQPRPSAAAYGEICKNNRIVID